ncbi:MAG: SusC/RagA family TonB-linked outer membrane protein [Paludibacteraceae bacterium]|nr:SusC/RagA family TonB-linked outer membrane protein [Paludibacteraceae bacterium]
MNKIYVLLLSFCLLSLTAVAQTKVTGVILDENGEGAIGATIMAEGTSVGTTTDFDGNFELNVPAGVKNLVISSVGYATQKVPVKSVIKVQLKEETQMVQEVVVTGMYQQDKRLNTGSTTRIDAEKAKLDGVADISRSLEGRAAGVSVQNVSGTFGTAPKIRMRGATSIYGSSKPLWVVDGVIMEDAVEVDAESLSSGDAVTLISSAIAGLNADDIESFQILKDGSATSIYGARAMAGVIVVTTKKGQQGQSKINYTGEFSIRLKPSYNEFNISNSQEQMNIYREMEQKGWLEFANLAKAHTSGIYGKMYQLINTYDPATGTYGLANTASARNLYLREAEYRNTDWFDLLFKNTVTQTHSISISGGTDRARFYTSMSAMYDPGWTLSSDVQRYTVNANASFDITKKLTLSLLTSDSYRKQKAPGTLSQEADVVTGEVKRDFDINPYSYALNASRAMDPKETYTRNYCGFNIFDELDNNYIELGVTDVKFQADLTYKPIKGLSFTALAAYRYQSSTNEHHVKDQSNQARAYRAGIEPEDATIRDSNPFLYTDPDDENALPETILPKGGMYFMNQYKMSQFDLRLSGTYNTAIKEKHILNFFAGMELNSTNRNTIGFNGYGFCYDDGRTPFVDYKLFKQQVEEGGTYYANSWRYARSMAFFATGTYSYLGRYNINLTGRYEGTNGLGKTQTARWLPTWNVGASWNAHEEEWFAPASDVLSTATLKASYSLTADRCPYGYSYAEPMFTSSSAWRPNAAAQELVIDLALLGNSELTYEKKYEFNGGVSLGFLKNRINLDVDAYYRDNFDLIGPTYTTGIGGESIKYANVATMKSSGVEVTISTTNIKTNDFKWTTDLTFSYTHNRITKLDSRVNVMSLVSGSGYAREGYPVRSLFSIPFVGLNDEGLPQFINQDNEVTVTDINFQEIENTNFLKYEGPTDPTITGGFGNIFTYKGFTLNIFMTYSFGNVVRLDPIFSSSYDDITALPRDFRNRWTLPGDEKVTNIPVIASTRQVQTYGSYNLRTAYNAYNYSTERIAKGDFIRMKEISLMYAIPAKYLSNVALNSASLKLQVTNPFLVYSDRKLNGQDPEFFNSGGVATPMAKQFTLTARIGF